MTELFVPDQRIYQPELLWPGREPVGNALHSPLLSNGLAARYTMSEGAGSTVFDMSGQSANGNITGATWDNKDGRTSLRFNGGTDTVFVPVPPVIAPPFAMSCWFMLTSTVSNDFCLLQLQDNRVGNNLFRLGMSAGATQQLRGSLSDGSGSNATTSNNVVVGKWHYAIVVYESSTYRRVILDADISNQGISTALRTPANINSLNIGREGDSSPADSWVGHISDVIVYGYAPSDVEVINCYRNQYADISPQNTIYIPTVAGGPSLQPLSIISNEAFGTAQVQTGAADLFPNAIPSAEALGAASLLTGGATITSISIASSEAHGLHAVQPGATSINLTGLGSAEAIGTSTVQTGTVILQLAAIDGAEAFGNAQVQSDSAVLSPVSIPSSEVVGTAALSSGGVVSLVSIDSSEAHGLHTVLSGSVSIDTVGINSAEIVGNVLVESNVVIVLPESISSMEQVGNALILNGAAVISPDGLTSDEQIGALTLMGGADVVGWLAAHIGIAVSLHGAIKSAPALAGKREVNRVH